MPGLQSGLFVMVSLMVVLQSYIFIMSFLNERSGSSASEASETPAAEEEESRTIFEFPFLTDPETIRYIATQIQMLFILSGVPNMRTKNLGQEIALTYEDTELCCFSTTHQSDDKLRSNDLTCEDQVKEHLAKGTQVIVVNSTASFPQDLQGIFTLAHQYDYTTLLVQANSTSSYRRAQSGAETPPGSRAHYPLFYGWFLGREISLGTQAAGGSIWGECIREPKFVEIFTKYALPGSPRKASGELDLDHYFSLEGLITGTTLLHCTSFFSNHSDSPDTRQYAALAAVRQGMGRAFNLTIIGFLATPRTFGARIRLADEELLLWGAAGNGACEEGSAGDDDAGDREIKLDPSLGGMPEPQVACPRDWRPTRFSPTCGCGSQAHLTLGRGVGIEAVQTGRDLDAIIQMELEAKEKKKDLLTLSLDSGPLRYYGEGNWCLYLDTPFQVGTLFATWY